VVNTTIAVDLEDINKKVKESSFALRTERCRLIQVKKKMEGSIAESLQALSQDLFKSNRREQL
jgi:hypothetical protein